MRRWVRQRRIYPLLDCANSRRYREPGLSLSPDFSSSPPPRVLLLALLVLAFFLRAVPALNYGQDWYGDDGFTLVNFDEGGSCRAALRGFDYSPFVGWQTLAIAGALGDSPPEGGVGSAQTAKAFCHSEGHLLIARLYSATTGALTVGALWLLATLLFPERPWVAPTAGALLALSGWHISESMVGTVDAASTFFIYAFICALIWSLRRGGSRWLIAVVLLAPAIFTKYWVFAVASLAAFLPPGFLATLFGGLSRWRIAILLLGYAAVFGLVSNPELPPWAIWLLPAVFYLIVPWPRLSATGRGFFLLAPWLAPLLMQVDVFVAFTAGSLEGRFGTDYGAIGWHKWLRNPINVFTVLVMGLGVPAFLGAVYGAGQLWKREAFDRVCLALLPLPAFALYMAFLAPVTYYRHYLPLLPAACLLAALGVSYLRPSRRGLAVALMVLWQALLAMDLVSDYHLDPRRKLIAWYGERSPTRVLVSYYVNPPPDTGAVHRLFRPVDADSRSQRLSRVDAVILSENWYDTAFANELNGPLVHDLSHLIKTTPESARFYRRAIADEHPMLVKREHFRAPSFMPELLLHYTVYGSFTQFVGDIVVFEVRP
ncbi:hypothetical protein KT71_05882 [Congregibacter litoralis KT71]|uniref:Glycosyltransferase RgtA/B/C/D-like domain-containing protein n=1 Tax=Congregibacter litoralis KT71 TaxID=314285 RepID=A4ABL7_9GAMM|nr:hypothetical protein KT71_05882 [Congregibacter litoralis KT71]